MTRADVPLLSLEHVDAFYGPMQVLYDVNLTVFSGEIVCLLGGNASGKSTTLKSILGLCRIRGGAVRFRNERIDRKKTPEIIAAGISLVPENRRIFPRLTVYENLMMGAFLRSDTETVKRDLEELLTLFPRLKDRLNQFGVTLSGGEQQMLAMARALMASPDLLLMDEPSMGLSPALVDRQFELIAEVNKSGATVFMVEQNAQMALSVADRGYVLQTGSIVLADTAKNLLENPRMQEAYLGGLECDL
jgi:branched-chain amino acid transport system ATP-binding protein